MELFLETLGMSVRDITFPSNCKIDERTPDRSSTHRTKKNYNFSSIVLGAGHGALAAVGQVSCVVAGCPWGRVQVIMNKLQVVLGATFFRWGSDITKTVSMEE